MEIPPCEDRKIIYFFKYIFNFIYFIYRWRNWIILFYFFIYPSRHVILRNLITILGDKKKEWGEMRSEWNWNSRQMQIRLKCKFLLNSRGRVMKIGVPEGVVIARERERETEPRDFRERNRRRILGIPAGKLVV